MAEPTKEMTIMDDQNYSSIASDRMLFEALSGLREFSETVATYARNYREWLEEAGWSESLAEHMAYQFYSMAIMTAMRESEEK